MLLERSSVTIISIRKTNLSITSSDIVIIVVLSAVDVEDIVFVLTVVLLICRAFVVEEMLFFGDSVIAVNVGAVDVLRV